MCVCLYVSVSLNCAGAHGFLVRVCVVWWLCVLICVVCVYCPVMSEGESDQPWMDSVTDAAPWCWNHDCLSFLRAKI